MLAELFQLAFFRAKLSNARFQATPIEFGSPHEAICAGFVDVCSPIIHFY
jgi:hypothetical protein